MPGRNAIFVTALTEVTTTQKEDLGKLRLEGNKWYKYVKFLNTSATVAGAAGDIAAYSAATGHNTHTVVLDKTDADSQAVAAGALQAAVAGVANTAYYGWLQIKGPATLNTDIGGTPSDGDQLMAGSTDLAVEQQTFAGTTPNILAAGAYCGVVTDDSAQLVYLDCPF